MHSCFMDSLPYQNCMKIVLIKINNYFLFLLSTDLIFPAKHHFYFNCIHWELKRKFHFRKDDPQYYRLSIYHGYIWYNSAHSTTITLVRLAFTNNIPYLALTGKLWGVLHELYEEKWLWYIDSSLYNPYIGVLAFQFCPSLDYRYFVSITVSGSNINCILSYHSIYQRNITLMTYRCQWYVMNSHMIS